MLKIWWQKRSVVGARGPTVDGRVPQAGGKTVGASATAARDGGRRHDRVRRVYAMCTPCVRRWFHSVTFEKLMQKRECKKATAKGDCKKAR